MIMCTKFKVDVTQFGGKHGKPTLTRDLLCTRRTCSPAICIICTTYNNLFIQKYVLPECYFEFMYM